MLSFVVPAYNEERLLGATLATLLASAATTGEPFEVIVVDDASTDRTGEIARSLGARVVPVHFRNIAAVRNAGARAASGEVLVFVDADTLVPPETLRGMLAALSDGAVGGGALVRLDAATPFWGRALTAVVSWALSKLRLAAGCFLFARRAAFDSAGGFDATYFASEEIHLSHALKAKGRRFTVVADPVTTSGRKFRLYSAWRFLQLAARVALGGRATLQRRDALGLWYDGQREHGDANRH